MKRLQLPNQTTHLKEAREERREGGSQGDWGWEAKKDQVSTTG